MTVGPGLGSSFPSATGHLVVLVHGLMDTGRCWQGTETQPGLAKAVAERPGLTAVSIVYNTGLSVNTNGLRLATILEALHSHWPVPVQSISLVGHSMGGLVIRSSCEEGRAADHEWIDRVADVVTLAAPHSGVPLEKFVHVVSMALNLAPETRPLADFLNGPSAGIKNLRHGTTVDGDLMIQRERGLGGWDLQPVDAIVLGGVRHVDLPYSSAAVDRVMDWIGPRSATEAEE